MVVWEIQQGMDGLFVQGIYFNRILLYCFTLRRMNLFKPKIILYFFTFSSGCTLPQSSIFELEWDVYLNYFRIITAMNRNDHYVTQLSLEVGLSI